VITPDEPDTSHKPDIEAAITAAKAGDVPTLRRLIERRPTLAQSDGIDSHLIELAVREGHLEAVRRRDNGSRVTDAV
jgi:hypothetical protein